MKKIAVSIFGFFMICVIGILVMVNGWGLEVISWPWVICGYLAMFIPATLTAMIE